MKTKRAFLLSCLVLLLGSTAFSQSEEFGQWQSLFDGKTTAGWVNVRGDNAGKAASRWLVEDGVLTNIKSGVDDICTQAVFSNYELEIEYKLPPGHGNSGVYLRGAVEVQICDNHDLIGKKAPELKSGNVGGIYSKTPPLCIPQKPGAWNKYRIRHLGWRITVWHNDVLVQDNVIQKENTGGCHPQYKGSPRKGPIMLQGNHSKIYYRNIRIRPLCTGDGWRPIWTGMDEQEDIAKAFSSSSNPKADNKVADFWVVDDHAVTNKRHRLKDMWTREHFENFLVHYEYKSDPDPKKDGGNSGFYLRDQWEIQIHGASSLTNKHADGSLYSMYCPDKLARHGPTQWNHMDVKVEGMKIWVWQNGTLIHNGRVCRHRTDSHGTPTLEVSRKPFKFQGDHGKVWFSNLYIKPLPDGK